MCPVSKSEHIAVEELRGDEITPFGRVAYIIAESDGVDVVFTNGEAHHWNYGDTLEVTNV
jgi:hypothetical protein